MPGQSVHIPLEGPKRLLYFPISHRIAARTLALLEQDLGTALATACDKPSLTHTRSAYLMVLVIVYRACSVWCDRQSLRTHADLMRHTSRHNRQGSPAATEEYMCWRLVMATNVKTWVESIRLLLLERMHTAQMKSKPHIVFCVNPCELLNLAICCHPSSIFITPISMSGPSWRSSFEDVFGSARTEGSSLLLLCDADRRPPP